MGRTFWLQLQALEQQDGVGRGTHGPLPRGVHALQGDKDGPGSAHTTCGASSREGLVSRVKKRRDKVTRWEWGVCVRTQGLLQWPTLVFACVY